MNSEIGKKIEVYSLDELPKVGEGFKFFSCIGGSKNYQCFIDSTNLSRADFMKKYEKEIDICHKPIYEDVDILIRQDAMYAVPGFYIVATKKSYKNIAQMELEVYQKCLLCVQRVRRLLKEEYGVNRAFIYYDEHYKKPSSTHFWVLPIYDDVIKENNLNATILSKDIWEYQELFKFNKTKEEIYKLNRGMTKLLERNFIDEI